MLCKDRTPFLLYCLLSLAATLSAEDSQSHPAVCFSKTCPNSLLSGKRELKGKKTKPGTAFVKGLNALNWDFKWKLGQLGGGGINDAVTQLAGLGGGDLWVLFP